MTALNNVKISLRIDDLSNWTNSSIILNNGEIALVRLSSNEIRMKCGNGTDVVSALPYINETEFFTKNLNANSLNLGLYNSNYIKSNSYAMTHGMLVSADGQFSEVHGVHANSLSSDSYAYVWNGSIANIYSSKGEGTYALNPKNGLSGLYIGEKSLANILAEKITIDGTPTTTLSIQHISQEDYHNIVVSDNGPNPNVLYIVSSDMLDMYGEKITNLAPGTQLSDAVNVEQLCSAISSISIPEIPTNISYFENDSKYTSLSIDGKPSELFEVKHVSQEEYHNLVTSENGIDPSTLYIVSSESINAYGETITNVADPLSANDAANKNYVDASISKIQDTINEIEIPTKVSELINDSIFATVNIDNEQISSLNVKHIGQKEYHDLVISKEGPLSNTLYIVSSETLNMYDERIENVAYSDIDTDAATVKYVKDQIGDLSISYLDKTISLQYADKTLAAFDASDFIVDGMLLSAYLNNDNLILEFNTESKKTAVSVDLHKYIDIYSAGNGLCAENGAFNIDENIVATKSNIETLDEKIDNKIKINGQSVSSFDVVNIDASEYYNLVTSENGPLSNTLYVVSSNEMNMFGEKITNLANGISTYDAANVGQLQTISNDLTQIINNIEIPNKVSQLSNDIGFTIANIDSTQTSCINIQRISKQKYYELVASENGIDPNTLYIVSSNALNVYNEKIVNLCAGTDLCDAVNLKQLITHITDFQVIRPNLTEKSLKLKVKIFQNQEMTDLVGEIDSSSKYMAAFFNNSNSMSWHNFTNEGLAGTFSNCPVLVKLSNWLADNNLEYTFERLFISYEWYYTEDGTNIVSDIYSIVIPSYTEVGANASDYISKTEHEQLASEIRKDAYIVSLNSDNMYVCQSNKTNIIEDSLSGATQVLLDSFVPNKQYDIKFTAGKNLKFKFLYDMGINGPEFDSSLNINKNYEFESGVTYLIKIKHDLIDVIESTYSAGNHSYKLITINPESDGKTYNIQNRSVSTIKISDSNTPVVINLPKIINGNYARDFILRVEITSSEAPQFTFTGLDSSWIAESEDYSWYEMKPGVNIISFTEMAK